MFFFFFGSGVNNLINFEVESETQKGPEYRKNCSMPGKWAFLSISRREGGRKQLEGNEAQCGFFNCITK